jgi:osmotically-inducible protein OsmY
MNRPFVGESSYGGSRSGTWGGGQGGYGSSGGYGGSGFGGGSFGRGGSSMGQGGYGSSYGQQQGGRGFWDRASDEVSSWFGDDDARRRREHDEHRGRGPKGYTRSDERIREDVNDRLTDDGWLDASDVEVQVSSAEVTLTGQVNSREEKRRAEDIAEAISGVKHVQNNLRVKERGSSSGQDSTTQFGTAGSGSSGSSSAGTQSGSTGSGKTR